MDLVLTAAVTVHKRPSKSLDIRWE